MVVVLAHAVAPTGGAVVHIAWHAHVPPCEVFAAVTDGCIREAGAVVWNYAVQGDERVVYQTYLVRFGVHEGLEGGGRGREEKEKNGEFYDGTYWLYMY